MSSTPLSHVRHEKSTLTAALAVSALAVGCGFALGVDSQTQLLPTALAVPMTSQQQSALTALGVPANHPAVNNTAFATPIPGTTSSPTANPATVTDGADG